MKALIAGGNGQLGQELQKKVPAGWTARFLSSRELDIRDAAAVSKAATESGPDLIINAAAYTAVDKAEEERDLAFAVNAEGAGLLAAAAATVGARVIHLSTDFVFDGSRSSPYRPEDEPHPIS
nr:sugar nucleotide-binding protein [Desulfobacteraceae bacterium]